MNKPRLLISSCLYGQNVRYDGGNSLINEIDQLNEKFELIPFCPEVQGGMVVPRMPCEIVSSTPFKIENEYGVDTTHFFMDGAMQALHICNENNIKAVLLKSKSPSCGNEKIYNGKFDGTLINGIGVTAQLLISNGFKVFNENQIKELYEYTSL